MQCPKCDTNIVGTRCACGYQVPGMPGPSPARRWTLCEWVNQGVTCQVRTGKLGAAGDSRRHRAPRFCAYHSERQRWSLRGTWTSEQQAFVEWASRFEPGTTYQPAPRIWDRDPEQLWRLVSGQITWDVFQAQTQPAISDPSGAPPAPYGLSMEEALADHPELLERLKRIGVGR